MVKPDESEFEFENAYAEYRVSQAAFVSVATIIEEGLDFLEQDIVWRRHGSG